jgi:uracil-DNA glycosylase
VSLFADNRLVDSIDKAIESLRGSDWLPVVQAWRGSPAGRSLVEFVDRRLAEGAVIFPANVFRALELTPLAATRVVVLGQDPYHGAGQAEGLAFSVPDGLKLPPSLRNIFAELRRDLGIPPATGGHLGDWARRGVLLLNTSLTVEEGQAGSHAKKGWEALTDSLIQAAAAEARPKVFLLWGAHAQAKAPMIEQRGHAHHLVLQSNHPSPLSATRGPVPFVGNGHFGRVVAFLAGQGEAQHPFGAQTDCGSTNPVL